jgi:ATP-binding cassette subfamily B protein
MDCGPAALKCLLDGFGLHASYGRLREACQTDVDGTSIDTLEDLANDAGLIAEQILLPVDHVTASADAVLPAIVVVRQPGGLLHFIVAWRRHGPFVQVMDPSTGRRWPTRHAFLDQLFAHSMVLPAETWRQWADSDLFQNGLRTRARMCGVGAATVATLVGSASEDPGWRAFASLDAGLRMVTALRDSHALATSDTGKTLTALYERARGATDPSEVIPEDYWTVTSGSAAGGEEQVNVRGAVLVRVTGVRSEAERAARQETLSREVVAALQEPATQPARRLLALLRADGVLNPSMLIVALMLAACGVVVEALLLRSLIDLGPHLAISGQRLLTMAALIALAVLLLGLEIPIARSAIGIGRRLEARLRIAFLEKIPRLADRYFQSRPTSDMAERCHAAHQIRDLPNLGVQLCRSVFELSLTAVAIALLYPASAFLAAAAAVAALAVPLIAQPWLNERDLRQRTHTGALTRFYLDAFLGLIAVRAHGAERSLAREQESLLLEWARAGRSLLNAALTSNAAQLIIGYGFAAWLLFAHLRRGEEGAGALLLAYFALNIPMLGQEIAQAAWQYPAQRNLTLRLLEPLGALEEESPGGRPSSHADTMAASGVDIRFSEVSVRAGGHTLVEGASLAIPAGSHVAVVGASGAGKSTLVGLLLGWHRPSSGSVTIDGRDLNPATLDDLRRELVWIDPSVHLWNRSMLENLEFGGDEEHQLPMSVRVEEAGLRQLVEQLPEGLQTPLGEGGALVSGGEGQRVRLGRGLGRPTARLVVLDEPFRGLDRDLRATFLRRARERWRAATLVCITHDISETSSFGRVIVMQDGRVVEDGDPAVLAGGANSRYRALLDAEAALRLRFSSDPSWHRLRLRAGKIVDEACEASLTV